MVQFARVAYFSMEIGLHPAMPTYAGGLGLLAGDMIRACADLRVPMVAVSLLYRKGYFKQQLDGDGNQIEMPAPWNPAEFAEELSPNVTVQVHERTVRIRAWRHVVGGIRNHGVPVYLLDTDLPANSDFDRTLTDHLYGGDHYYRLCQEVVLGIGGVRMLRALGHRNIERFHMNEGHASLLTLELLAEKMSVEGRRNIGATEIEEVRKSCVFTTHTPVPAGHDKFDIELAHAVIRQRDDLTWWDTFRSDGTLNLTELAMRLSHYVNAVAKRHGEVSRQMFPGQNIDAITNGVHGPTWTAEPFRELYDRYLHDWRWENLGLHHATSISKQEIWDAHQSAKRSLIELVNSQHGASMDVDAMTIGFARRAATYKRADLIFTDVQRLKSIAAAHGPLQIIFAGKAHPRDTGGKELIKSVFDRMRELAPHVKAVYIPDYDMRIGQMITAGVDVWLNTPQRPMEASGTSGMKAALNGVPSLSILDGWWVEGCIEGVTGWAIGGFGPAAGQPDDASHDAEALYDKLDRVVVPLFYQQRECFIGIMRQAIALSGSRFNAQRMAEQYITRAYFSV